MGDLNAQGTPMQTQKMRYQRGLSFVLLFNNLREGVNPLKKMQPHGLFPRLWGPGWTLDSTAENLHTPPPPHHHHTGDPATCADHIQTPLPHQ